MSDGIGWLTPDDLEGVAVCRTVTLSSHLWRFINEGLTLLANPENWVQFGTVTPEEAASYFQEVFDSLGECMGKRLIGQFPGGYPAPLQIWHDTTGGESTAAHNQNTGLYSIQLPTLSENIHVHAYVGGDYEWEDNAHVVTFLNQGQVQFNVLNGAGEYLLDTGFYFSIEYFE